MAIEKLTIAPSYSPILSKPDELEINMDPLKLEISSLLNKNSLLEKSLLNDQEERKMSEIPKN